MMWEERGQAATPRRRQGQLHPMVAGMTRGSLTSSGRGTDSFSVPNPVSSPARTTVFCPVQVKIIVCVCVCEVSVYEVCVCACEVCVYVCVCAVSYTHLTLPTSSYV